MALLPEGSNSKSSTKERKWRIPHLEEPRPCALPEQSSRSNAPVSRRTKQSASLPFRTLMPGMLAELGLHGSSSASRNWPLKLTVAMKRISPALVSRVRRW